MQTLDLTVGARVYDNKMKLCRGEPGRSGTEEEQGRNGARRFLGHCQDQHKKSLAYLSFSFGAYMEAGSLGRLD